MSAARTLTDLTIKEALDYLAERVVVLRERGKTFREKQAQGGSDVFTALGDYVRKYPVASKALLGGGIGALAGAGTHLLPGGEQDVRGKRRGMLSSALLGGLSGGALGFGVGMAQKHMPFGGNVPSSASTAKGGDPGERLPLGQFRVTGPDGKKTTVQIPPNVLKEDPGILARAQEYTAPRPLPDRLALGAVGEAAKGVYVPKFNPEGYLSPWLMSGLLGTDVAFHQRVKPLGDAIGFGAVSPRHSVDPEDLRRGLESVEQFLGKDKYKQLAPALNAITDADVKRLGRQAHIPANTGVSGMSTPDPIKTTTPVELDETRTREMPPRSEIVRNAAGNPVLDRHGNPMTVQHPGGKQIEKLTGTRPVTQETPGTPVSVMAPADKLMDIKAHGARTRAAEKGVGITPNLRRMGGFQWQRAPLAAGIGGRVLGYGAIPAAEYVLRSWLEEKQRQRSVDEMMSKFQKVQE